MAATCARSFTLVNFGSAMMARRPMIATTVTSSMRVNPARFMWAESRKRRAAEVPRAACPEVSERVIAEALYPYPQGLVIATKAGLERPGPDQWTPNGRPEHLRAACEGSLRRLKLDRIDLYQLHRIDPDVPFADQLGTLKRLQEEGKIRYAGLWEVSVADIERARKIVGIVWVKTRYSASDRQHESVLDHCERERLAFLPWYPLGAGAALRSRTPLARVAARLHSTPAQVAIAWLLRRSPVMLPIPGTSSVKHLEENVAAALLELSAADFEEIARAS